MYGTVSSTSTVTTTTSVAVVKPRDPSVMYRLVGYQEYSNSLSYLQRLVQSSTVDELKVIDAVVRDYGELGVYTNLSRRFAPQQPSPLAEIGSDNYERRGLAWVMALARVELGAMLAGFSNQKDPFFAVGRPSPGELPALKELLWDGARTHYWALMADPQVERALEASAGSPRYMAHGRRLFLTLAFLEAATNLTSGELTPAQRQEASSWNKDLEKLGLLYVTKLADSLGQRTRTTSSAIQETTSLWSCPQLVNAAMIKLSGKQPTIGAVRPDNDGSGRVERTSRPTTVTISGAPKDGTLPKKSGPTPKKGSPAPKAKPQR